jgi:hypothetical protein
MAHQPQDELTFVQFLLGMGGLFLIVCMCRGLYRFAFDLFNINKRWTDRKRNSLPDSVIDQTARVLIGQMMREEKNEFQTAVVSGKEIIKSRDGRITLRYYGRADNILLEIEGVGSFAHDKFKPEIAQELSRVCLTLKDYIATVLILKPEAVETRQLDAQ